MSNTKTSVLEAVLIRPEALRRKTRSSDAAIASSAPLLLTLCQLHVTNPAVLDADKRSVQDPLAVVRTRIDAYGAAQASHPASLVDVSVKPQSRLVGLNQLAYGGASRRRHDGVATLVDGSEVVIEFGALVQICLMRWNVDVEDGPVRISEFVDHGFDLRPQPVLAQLALRVPWRLVRPAGRQDLKPIELDDLAFQELDGAGEL